MGKGMGQSPTDEQLVQKVTTGDTEAFGVLIDRYEKKLLRYTEYILGSRELAEDVTQDTFIKAYENLQSFDTKRKFSSWLYRIAHNTAINKINKDKRLVQLDFDLLTAFLPSREKGVEEEYERKETAEHVRDCLNRLDTKYKDVLILSYLEDKSYEEISNILRIPTGTVGTRISRAKEAMKKLCQIK